MTNNEHTILALCAHPDDAEIRIGGTLLLLARRGWKVHIATLSTGDCGSGEESPNAIAMRRRAEAEKAAAYLGGVYHSLGGQDLRVFDNDHMRGVATTLIREVNPDCIVTHFPVDYMPDHEVASALTRAASFCAPIVNYVAGPSSAVAATTGLVPLYYFCPLDGVDYLGNPVKPHFHVDISSVSEQKVELLGCHESQRDWLRRQHGMDDYINQMRKWDEMAGMEVGVSYAEGLFVHRGHAYPRTPLIQEALSEFVREASLR